MCPSDFDLVVTVALKKELPLEWLTSRRISVHTLAALKSGALRSTDRVQNSLLIIITGTGLTASREAACWIRDNLSPLFVLNIGTCGLLNHSLQYCAMDIRSPVDCIHTRRYRRKPEMLPQARVTERQRLHE